jgi:hypothetical protein
MIVMNLFCFTHVYFSISFCLPSWIFYGVSRHHGYRRREDSCIKYCTHVRQLGVPFNLTDI